MESNQGGFAMNALQRFQVMVDGELVSVIADYWAVSSEVLVFTIGTETVAWFKKWDAWLLRPLEEDSP